VDRSKQGMKRSSMTDGYGIALHRALARANRHDSPLLAATLDTIGELGPLPVTSGSTSTPRYDSLATRGAKDARPDRP
jgi:hypothetical protein